MKRNKGRDCRDTCQDRLGTNIEETLRGKGRVLQEEAVGSVLRLSRAAPDNSNDHAGTRGDVKELWYVGTKEEAISPDCHQS